MKIALFSDTYEEGYGGVTVYVRELSKFLINQGHDVKVFVWESKNFTEEDRKVCETFPAIKVVKEVRGKAGIAPESITLKVKRFSPDLIHNHSQYLMGLHAIAVSKILKIPLINHYHMYLEKITPYLPYILQKTKKLTSYSIESYTKLFFDSGDLVVTPTQVMKNYLKKIGVNKTIKVVPFGIDFNKFGALEIKKDETFTFLYVGRLNKEKNVNLLVESFNKFAKDKNVKLKIIGDGPEKKNIKEFIKEKKLENKVKILGWKKREVLPLEYSSAHCFITLSDSETFGIVILEAMACGLPIIGANEAAIPELVENGTNGFLVDIKNKDSILDKMNQLYKNPNLQIEFSKKSKIIAKKFDEYSVFKSLEDIYLNLVNEKNN